MGTLLRIHVAAILVLDACSSFDGFSIQMVLQLRVCKQIKVGMIGNRVFYVQTFDSRSGTECFGFFYGLNKF